MNYRDEPRREMNKLYVTQPLTQTMMAYESLQPHYTTLSDGSLSLLFCEWRNHLHASCYIASFIPHSPTSPTAFTHFSQFHTRSNDSWAKSGISWFHGGMHAGPLFFLIPTQKQGQHCKFVWMTWHSHSIVQLSLHLWGEAEFTQLSLSFHPHPQQCMDPNGVVLWLPSSTTVPPLDPNGTLVSNIIIITTSKHVIIYVNT